MIIKVKATYYHVLLFVGMRYKPTSSLWLAVNNVTLETGFGHPKIMKAYILDIIYCEIQFPAGKNGVPVEIFFNGGPTLLKNSKTRTPVFTEL